MKQTICNYVLGIAVVVLIFAVAIDFWTFNDHFYAYEYHKSQTAQAVGVTESDLFKASDYLFDYLKGKHEDLDIEIKVKDHLEPFYNHKDFLHMEDVKDIYFNFKTFSLTTLISTVALITYLYLTKSPLKAFYLAYKRILTLFSAVVAACLFMMVVDFQNFWFYFHYLLFDNDLWLISPKESNLIILMNETLFNDLLFLITFSIIIMLSVLSLGLKYFIDRKEKLV